MNKNLINFLISLRNASLSKKTTLKVKNVKALANYAAILYQEGFIQSYIVTKKDKITGEQFLIINLRSFEDKVMTENIHLLSTPSKMKILSCLELIQTNLKNKLIVLSTSKGIMSHRDCIKKKLGGVAVFSC